MSDLARLDAAGLLRLLASRDVSAVEVVRHHLERIDRLDGDLHAVLRVNPRAEEEARRQDVEIAAGRAGPLAGLPVAIKDNILTEGLETTCGSRILEGFVPPRDATAVARLRAAGAVVLCKTNMDEFAMGSSTENSAFGPTRNPWDLERVPGGSSGGSAAAVAAALAPAALGSDTGGSVRQPAAFCGVVGLKPTYGRVSRLGLVAFGSSLDQIGTLTTSVEDAAGVLRVIAGDDPLDSTCVPLPVPDYVGSLGTTQPRLRVGVPKEYYGEGLDPEIGARLEQAADELARNGSSVEPVSLPHTRYAIPTYYVVATAEASSNLARYDGVRYGLRSDRAAKLHDMIRATRGAGFGAEVKRRIMLGTFALSAGYHDQFYGRAERVRTLLRRDFLELFRSGIDVLLTPVTPSTAFRIGEKSADPLAMYLSDVHTATVNLAGLPAISVPVGLSSAGLPIGAQLVGPDFSEGILLGAAMTLERAFGRFRPEGFLPAGVA